jgi:thiamine biosynthesis lipoprotein
MRYFLIRSLFTGAVFSLWMLVACSTDPGSAPEAQAPPRAAAQAESSEQTVTITAGGGPVLLDPPPEPTTVKRAQYLMGTIAEITAVAAHETIAQEAVTSGFQEIRRLEQLFSTWIETSELSQVNRAAGRERVPVSPETFELLTRAVEMGELTGGAFDITVGPAVRLWKVTEGQRVPSAMELAIAAQYVDYRLIQLDSKNRTVFLSKPGMQIDVGGIGKGYAAERAAAAMQGAGAGGGLVAIAGDIRTFGRRGDGTAWPVGLQHPRKRDAVLATLDASDEAVSTSGDYERFFFKNGLRYHHILNPRTLMPARLCQSVTIVAPNATTADALATGVFVMGPVTGLALVERLKLGAVVVDNKGRVTVSSRLRSRVHSTPD